MLFSALFFTILIALPLQSFALGDVAVVAQLVKNLREMQRQYDVMENQLKQLKSGYTLMHQQYNTLQSLQRDAQGHYGFGNFLNSVQALKAREWSPDNWHDALKGLAGGNAKRYQQLLQAYKDNHLILPKNEYEKGSSPDNAKLYESQVQTNQAASVNATYAFNTIKTHLNNIHALSMQIENAKNTKAAVDLNSRLLAEMAYIQVQELKMQTLLNEQSAQSSANSIAGESEAAKFNQLPKN